MFLAVWMGLLFLSFCFLSIVLSVFVLQSDSQRKICKDVCLVVKLTRKCYIVIAVDFFFFYPFIALIFGRYFLSFYNNDFLLMC